jgi:PKD repeat protein
MKKILLYMILLFLCYRTANAQQIVSYEYWFDSNNAGVVSVPVSNQTEYDLNTLITTTSLSTGVHFIHIRFKDSNGIYSCVLSQPFYNTTFGSNQSLVTYEYWFDSNYAGRINQSLSNVSSYNLNSLVNAAGLSEGFHSFHIRFGCTGGFWTGVLSQPFYKIATLDLTSNLITSYRYYYNDNSSQMHNIYLSSPATYYDILTQLASRNYTHPDSNILHIEVKDTLHNWSVVVTDTFWRPYIPVASFKTNVNEICKNESIIFTDSTTEADSYLWNFGDGNTSTVFSPTHQYTTSGAFTVSLTGHSSVSGLDSTITHNVTVYPLPTATVSGTLAVCRNSASPNITFTGAAGTSPYTFTYKINSGSNLTVSTTSGNSVTVAAPTGIAGTFIYSLVSVSDNHGCSQAQSGTATITVYPLPTATINGTIALCQNATSPNITFTGAAGTTPYTFTYTINGGSNLTVSTTSGNSVTVAAPTGIAGTFIYSLVSVSDNHGCSQAQSGTATITVYQLPTATISGTTAICFGSSTNLSVALTGTQPWSITYTDGTTPVTINGITTSPNIINVSPSATKTYTVTAVSDANCTGTSMTGSAIVTVDPFPSAAGVISGPLTFLPGSSGNAYSVSPIADATSYIWSYSGTGATINGTDNSVTIDFSASATNGQLTVKGHNNCGDGAVSTALSLSGIRILNLTAVLLEALYSGNGLMIQAKDENGSHWSTGIADHIAVELHSSDTYSTLVYSATDVPLSTTGTATVSIPAAYNGLYYITIRHRNSIETITHDAVSFAGSMIYQSFGVPSNIYGNNIGGPISGHYLIYAGDVNQDGFVDTGDYIGIDNDSYNYLTGYLITDVNGDGTIDTGDYIKVDNNSYKYVHTIHP